MVKILQTLIIDVFIQKRTFSAVFWLYNKNISSFEKMIYKIIFAKFIEMEFKILNK